MSKDAEISQRIYLKDYAPPDYTIAKTELHLNLDRTRTRVRARLTVQKNGEHDRPLVLHGEKLDLISLSLSGEKLNGNDWQRNDESLTLLRSFTEGELEIETEINPAANSELSGLYASADTLCTQCEPEGFRRITYFLDRPDVLSVYRVTLTAVKADYPVLLANGNLIESHEDGQHHTVVWDDPHPKPSYLFAVVAGRLEFLEDRFTTQSGEPVQLRVYARSRDLSQCHYALAALRESMIWDEKTYGREYDLSQYNIVAVEDFNMGAMENKGLNVFNTRYVLALPETATDQDYQGVRDVIGHEYLHNWSGNRVTLRDWFQLSLKEGFTVFREQQFSADHGSAGVKRIEDANLVRTQQFREDAGPMAHAVRPDSFVEINNFYTLTVYIKGAEVVRMLSRLVGEQAFFKGCTHYFEQHDGQAVTTDDFVSAIEHASQKDLSQFRRWYEQPGTPRIRTISRYDSARQSFQLNMAQSNLDSLGQGRAPLQIPIAVALFDRTGKPLQSRLNGVSEPAHEHLLDFTNPEQGFHFEGVESEPIVSFLRGFSAPVIVETDLPDADLAVLAGFDNDPFSRWDAGQTLARKEILRWMDVGDAAELNESFANAFGETLKGDFDDQAFQALALRLPDESYLSEFVDKIDPTRVHNARQAVMTALAQRNRELFLARYESLTPTQGLKLDAGAAGARSLRNTCLAYLMLLGEEAIATLALKQLTEADNMTDAIAALALLAHQPGDARNEALAFFENRWRDYPLVMDKWLRVQATSRAEDTLDRVRELTSHPCYHDDNPNKVYSLISAFAHANPLRFHCPSGNGYAFVADQLLKTDAKNPQVAARLASAFNLWRRFEPGRRALMKQTLERISATQTLSRDVGEIIERALAAEDSKS